MDSSYIIIADDFAGANDTGIQFIQARQDHPLVLLDPSPMTVTTHNPCNILVIDSDTRNCTAEEAAQKIRGIATALKQRMGKARFYLKVDSTLRGNIATLAHTMQEVLGFDCVAYTPAYPQNGRTVKDDTLFLNGVPVNMTPLNSDPLNPVLSSSVAASLTLNGQSPVHISLDCIRKNEITRLLADSGQNAKFFAFDAETDADLRDIADAVHAIYDRHRVLWVGSAGLARILVHKADDYEIVRKPPVLAIIGSFYPINQTQIEEAVAHNAATSYPLDIKAFRENPDEMSTRAHQEIGNLLAQGRNVILAADLSGIVDDFSSARALYNEACEALLRFLPEILLVLLHNHRIQGLYLCGSKISAAILKRLGTYGADLIRELENGIPLLKLKGGLCNGLPAITKAGSFGDKGALVRAVARLQSMDN